MFHVCLHFHPDKPILNNFILLRPRESIKSIFRKATFFWVKSNRKNLVFCTEGKHATDNGVYDV